MDTGIRRRDGVLLHMDTSTGTGTGTGTGLRRCKPNFAGACFKTAGVTEYCRFPTARCR
jgi:hypothetical protein